ncbi:MAG TPA: AMP-binding protein [Methylovorus sp.]|nr:AMP-binding protein [Methylovorus sp.]
MSHDTLPGLLQHQAAQRGADVAIRHKQLGIWHVLRWQEVWREVQHLAAVLQARGFQKGDALFLLSHPRPQALLLQLAAQWLGGVAAPVDLLAARDDTLRVLQGLRPTWVFAEGEDEIALLAEAGAVPRLLIYADQRGVVANHSSAHLAYAEALALAAETVQAAPQQQAPLVAAVDHAFAFYRLEAQQADQAPQLQLQTISHHELLNEGRRLLRQENLKPQDEALAARAFAASGHARYLLAPWLLAGFRLNFPENLATRDNDRRELGPTLVAGTRETYQRLESLVQQRLPQAGSWRRRLVDWALRTSSATRKPLVVSLRPVAKPPRFSLQLLLAQWLVINPLRDVIGFSRTRVPLLVGEPLPESSLRFFHSLGIEVRNWEEQAYWYVLEGGKARVVKRGHASLTLPTPAVAAASVSTVGSPS